MTTVICLYGGPGTGKSTSAAKLFSFMKEIGLNAELANEYVKQWAWEGRSPVDLDQFYFFGKQARKEYSLFGKVDYLITDAPLAITCYYTQVYGTPEQAELFNAMFKTYMKMCEEKGHLHRHIFLERVKEYNPAGRYQTEEEARLVDVGLREYLSEIGVSVDTVPGGPRVAQDVAELVGFHTPQSTARSALLQVQQSPPQSN